MRAAIALLLIGCAMKGDARPKPVELKNAPVTVTMNLPRHDPKRHLMLRIEGISVEGEVATWEVRVGNVVAGTLSTYGAEEQNGKFVAAVPVNVGAERTLRITFAPTARVSGTIRFQRLRLVDE